VPAHRRLTVETAYRCPCGERFRVFGIGRHRRFHLPSDETLSHPVINRACPACGHDLPGKRARGRS
jgi:hypothetical protein